MSNPFNENPWQESGPRFGNAYESTNNPAHINTYQQPIHAPPSPSNYMPAYNTTGYNNTWGTESNKTEYPPQSAYDGHNMAPPPIQPNAYQYTGTPYGNPSYQTNVPSVTPLPPHHPTKPTGSVGPEPWTGEVYHPPSKWNFWLRFLLLLASIGHLGFAAGARPYSGEDIPFYTTACFYYLFAVAVLSIIWTGVNTFSYCYTRVAKKNPTKKGVIFLCDLIMALLWGIGVIVEVVQFRCPNGGKFCTFYNVSIFFGFLAFAGFILTLFWDVFSGCCSKRKS
ncbi:hypothetical protein BDF21DRAFT_432770 [Thamnidium elegans]|nr:hypothetical protein BDF21DRAFT_432770 [Thamnidium elegans]